MSAAGLARWRSAIAGCARIVTRAVVHAVRAKKPQRILNHKERKEHKGKWFFVLFAFFVVDRVFAFFAVEFLRGHLRLHTPDYRMAFSKLGLSAPVLEGVKAMGYI